MTVENPLDMIQEIKELAKSQTLEDDQILDRPKLLNMGVMVLKKISLLFLLISACFLSTSFAGRISKFVEKPAMEVGATKQAMEKTSKPLHQDELSDVVHERLLRMNKNDYGRYDPAPALVKPPFKLIPN